MGYCSVCGNTLCVCSDVKTTDKLTQNGLFVSNNSGLEPEYSAYELLELQLYESNREWDKQNEALHACAVTRETLREELTAIRNEAAAKILALHINISEYDQQLLTSRAECDQLSRELAATRAMYNDARASYQHERAENAKLSATLVESDRQLIVMDKIQRDFADTNAQLSARIKELEAELAMVPGEIQMHRQKFESMVSSHDHAQLSATCERYRSALECVSKLHDEWGGYPTAKAWKILVNTATKALESGERSE